MKNLLTDLKTYLNDNLDLITDGTLIYKVPFVIAKPNFSNRSVNMVVLTNRINEQPVQSLAIDPMAYNPRLQVRVRSELYQDGESMVTQVEGLFEDIKVSFTGISTDCYGGFSPVQLHEYLGQDNNDNHMWSWNYTVLKHTNT